jgi:diguanylate cyclase (GGDEF)-like protein
MAHPVHWAVTMNRLNRAVAYAFLAAMVGTHWLEQGGMPLWAWGLLMGHCALISELVYQTARRAAQPLEAEMRWMHVDGVFFGLWVGASGVPLWIGYVLGVGVGVGVAISVGSFRGPRGMVAVIALFILSGLVALGLTGATVHTATGPWTTGISMLALTVYLLVFAQAARGRTLRLHEVKAQLRLNETALQDTNRSLQQQLSEIEQLRDRLAVQAQRDALTGLFNRHYLTPTLDRELARTRRAGQPLSLWLLDIDHFKPINDRYGHLTGDQVLVKFAQTLAQHARQEDVPCRFGGEEFVLLAPGMDASVAVERADALRQRMASLVWLDDHPELRCTVSIGVAVAPQDGDTSQALLMAADQALYAAKAAGRNQVHTPPQR